MTENGFLVMSGPPCSGKSSAAAALTSETRLYIKVDAIFELLLPRSNRNAADRMLAYDAAHRIACLVFERGLTPVLECTYSRAQQRESLIQAMAQYPAAPLWIAEFTVSGDEAVRRFRQSPSHQATDLDEALVRERATSFPYSPDALQLNSESSAPQELSREIMTWVDSIPRTVDRDNWLRAGKPQAAP